MSYRQNGHRYFVDLGILTFEMHCVTDSTMALTVVEGGGILPDGHTETVTTTVAEVRPHVYLTSWRGQRGTRVLHLEDFERGRVHSRILPPGSAPVVRLGTLTQLRSTGLGGGRRRRRKRPRL